MQCLFHHWSFASGLSTCFAHGSWKIRANLAPSAVNPAFTWLQGITPHNKNKHQNGQSNHSQHYQCITYHLRRSSIVYSTSRMWAIGLSQPLLMHSAMTCLYCAGQWLLTSNPALGTTRMPSGENEKSVSFGRSVLCGRLVLNMRWLYHEWNYLSIT